MKNKIKLFIKKVYFLFLYGNRANSTRFIRYLTNKGIKVGAGTVFYSPQTISVDTLNPHLVEIGSHCQITSGVRILTHDYSWSVIKKLTGEILGNQKRVQIGNNCFIGVNTIILCGTTIGDNVIIGAGSVCSGLLESNSVYAGNPVRKIMSVSQFIEKRKQHQIDEAVDIYRQYYNTFNEKPSQDVFHEYFMLFSSVADVKEGAFNRKMHLMDNYDESIRFLAQNNRIFDNYDEFCKYAEQTIMARK